MYAQENKTNGALRSGRRPEQPQQRQGTKQRGPPQKQKQKQKQKQHHQIKITTTNDANANAYANPAKGNSNSNSNRNSKSNKNGEGSTNNPAIWKTLEDAKKKQDLIRNRMRKYGRDDEDSDYSDSPSSDDTTNTTNTDSNCNNHTNSSGGRGRGRASDSDSDSDSDDYDDEFDLEEEVSSVGPSPEQYSAPSPPSPMKRKSFLQNSIRKGLKSTKCKRKNSSSSIHSRRGSDESNATDQMQHLRSSMTRQAPQDSPNAQKGEDKQPPLSPEEAIRMVMEGHTYISDSEWSEDEEDENEGPILILQAPKRKISSSGTTATMASGEDYEHEHDQYQEEHGRTQQTGKRVLALKKKKPREDTHPRTSNNNKNYHQQSKPKPRPQTQPSRQQQQQSKASQPRRQVVEKEETAAAATANKNSQQRALASALAMKKKAVVSENKYYKSDSDDDSDDDDYDDDFLGEDNGKDGGDNEDDGEDDDSDDSDYDDDFLGGDDEIVRNSSKSLSGSNKDPAAIDGAGAEKEQDEDSIEPNFGEEQSNGEEDWRDSSFKTAKTSKSVVSKHSKVSATTLWKKAMEQEDDQNDPNSDIMFFDAIQDVGERNSPRRQKVKVSGAPPTVITDENDKNKNKSEGSEEDEGIEGGGWTGKITNFVGYTIGALAGAGNSNDTGDGVDANPISSPKVTTTSTPRKSSFKYKVPPKNPPKVLAKAIPSRELEIIKKCQEQMKNQHKEVEKRERIAARNNRQNIELRRREEEARDRIVREVVAYRTMMEGMDKGEKLAPLDAKEAAQEYDDRLALVKTLQEQEKKLKLNEQNLVKMADANKKIDAENDDEPQGCACVIM